MITPVNLFPQSKSIPYHIEREQVGGIETQKRKHVLDKGLFAGAVKIPFRCRRAHKNATVAGLSETAPKDLRDLPVMR